MGIKIKNPINYIKNFFSKQENTKNENYIIGGSAATLVAAIVISIATSSLHVVATPVEELAAEDIVKIESSDIEAATEYTDGVYVDGLLVSTQVYAVVVDGEDIVYLISEENAQSVLDEIISRYQTPGSQISNAGFAEDVTIERREFEWPAPVFPVNDAVSYIVTGTTTPKTHVIQGGDNLWDIAIANGISPSTLEEMNPGLNPNRLRIGEEIYLYATQSFVTFSFTELVTTQERVPYGIIFEDTDSLYRGQTQVRIAGSFGSREVVSEITRENGVVVGTRVLSEELISEPVAQVALRGTTPQPVVMGAVGAGSGQFAHPLSDMRVISNFGSRGGRLHRGVDLGGPVGTPIYAAADGVVTRSGYSGSFGNVIFLSHGDGVETVYAHNQTNLVAVGDTVVQGQKIATMGATGNATASHLHFEIRINGQSHNPMNFL